MRCAGMVGASGGRQRTAALDMDNDGNLTASEILSVFKRMSCLSGVPSDDKYARAVITEVRQLSDLSDCASVQEYIEPKLDEYGWLGGCDRLLATIL